MYKDKLAEIQTIIDEIEKQIQDTECVFRGEPECYEKISCGAFREYTNVEDTFRPSTVPTDLPGLFVNTQGLEIRLSFTASKEAIQQSQEEMLKNLQHHIGEADNADLLSMAAILQHIGHGTYLLDFTKDYLIALFFACRKEFDVDGRITLLRTDNQKYKFHDMAHKKELRLVEGRAEAQKSILVDCPDFFVEETDHYYVCRISKNLKVPFMEYLKDKGISEETMFPDYLGFIKKEEDRKQSHKNFREGLEFENRKKYDEAIQCYNKAINLKYDFASAYKHRGYAWYMKKELNKAEEDLTKSLYFDPADMHTTYTINETLALVEPGFAHHYRSRIYMEKKEKDKALRDCSKAIDIAPDSAWSYFQRGQIYANNGELENAITDLSRGLKIEPYNPKALGLRGKIHLQKGNIDNAMNDFNKAIEMNTDDPQVLTLRGKIYWQKGKIDEAIGDFSKSIAINTDDPETLMYRGIGNAIKGRLDQAIDDLSKAIEIKPDDSETLKNRAKVYYNTGKIDKAINDLRRVMKLKPNDAEALELLTIVQEKEVEKRRTNPLTIEKQPKFS